MLISHEYKFIYLRTEKTASTSLFWTLRGIIEETAEVLAADASVRSRLLREHGSLEGFSFVGRPGALRRRFPQFFGLHFHARARNVRDFIGRDLFERYLVISSERNPWDRQLSLINHRRRTRGRLDARSVSACMHSIAYNALHHNRLRNWEVYTIDGAVCADVIIRYERLEEDYRNLLTRLGIDPQRYPLKHKRDGGRAGGTSYRDLYDEHARQRVAEWYRPEIEHFGYEF